MKKGIGVLTLVCTGVILTATGTSALAGAHQSLASSLTGARHPVTSIPASTRFHLAPRRAVSASTSTNWAGYATQRAGTTDVKGQWVVPSVTCTGGTQYSSTWVGIDGYSSTSVEQEGTEQDCSGQTPSYYSWYEICCIEPAIPTPMAVHPGDTVTAETKYLGSGWFQMILHNLTTGGSFSKYQRYRPAQRTSAEWIEEAPSNGGILPLANFGTVQITNAQATIGGTTGVISSFPNTSITMVNTSGQVKAQTSGLGSGGNNFTVTWVRSQ